MNQSVPDELNPYAVVDIEETSGAQNPELVEFERIRRLYLNHEASVKSIGTLYMLGGLLGFLLAALGLLYRGVAAGAAGPQLLSLGVAGVSAAQIVAAFGIRKLVPWARILAALVAAIGLLGVPIGTLISLYFLYLLLSKKGAMVFSDHYQEVIAATPHIKYKTSILVWLVLLVLIGFVITLTFFAL